MFCKVMRAFESPWDLTTGHDDIFEVGFFSPRNAQKLLMSSYYLLKQSWWAENNWQLQQIPKKLSCNLIFDASSQSKGGTNIEDKESCRAMQNNEDGCWWCFSNDNTWRTEKMRSCGTNMNKPLEDRRMLLGIKLLWLFCTWGKFDGQGACLQYRRVD